MHPQERFETAFCRWTCPLCGITRVCVRNDTACNSISNNLRTHIRATDDADHGPHGDVPSEMEAVELDEYVVCDKQATA